MSKPDALTKHPETKHKYSHRTISVWKCKEESKFYELFAPTRYAVKKCRHINVLLEKDSIPVAAEKIEKQRIEAGKKLERIETDSQAQTLVFDPKAPLYWMTFGYWLRRPFSFRQELVIWIDGQGKFWENASFLLSSTRGLRTRNY